MLLHDKRVPSSIDHTFLSLVGDGTPPATGGRSGPVGEKIGIG